MIAWRTMRAKLYGAAISCDVLKPRACRFFRICMHCTVIQSAHYRQTSNKNNIGTSRKYVKKKKIYIRRVHWYSHGGIYVEPEQIQNTIPRIIFLFLIHTDFNLWDDVQSWFSVNLDTVLKSRKLRLLPPFSQHQMFVLQKTTTKQTVTNFLSVWWSKKKE